MKLKGPGSPRISPISQTRDREFESISLQRREMVWGRRRDFLPGSQEVKWRDGNPPTNAWLPGFITAYNTRFGRDPANAKSLPLA